MTMLAMRAHVSINDLKLGDISLLGYRRVFLFSTTRETRGPLGTPQVEELRLRIDKEETRWRGSLHVELHSGSASGDRVLWDTAFSSLNILSHLELPLPLSGFSQFSFEREMRRPPALFTFNLLQVPLTYDGDWPRLNDRETEVLELLRGSQPAGWSCFTAQGVADRTGLSLGIAKSTLRTLSHMKLVDRTTTGGRDQGPAHWNWRIPR